jgi:rhodanese-related sulfurtransferase
MAETQATTLAEALAAATARIDRLTPMEAFAELAAGAVLVDTRSLVARAAQGVVPGSIHMERTVLEWRLAPDSDDRSPHAPGTGERVIVLCDHGHSSVFAADTLRQLGFARAADVVGGFDAWKAAGLPLRAASDEPLRDGELPGMRGPA